MRCIATSVLVCLSTFAPAAAQGGGTSAVGHDQPITTPTPAGEPPPRFAVQRIDPATAREAQPVEPVPAPVVPPGFTQRPVSFDLATRAEAFGAAVAGEVPGPGGYRPGSVATTFETPELLDAFGSGSPINSTAFPWSAQVRVFFSQNGSGFVCSGTLVDARTVMTAGHCVHTGGPSGSWSTNVSISAAWDGDDDAFGSANGVQLFSWTGWTQSSDYNWDIGYIRLDRPIGALTNWLGFGWNGSNSFFTGNTFHHAAYPGCQGTTCFCAFAGCPHQLIYAFGPFDSVSTHRLTMNLPNWCMTGGMSGGGIYDIDASNNRFVYGVNSTRGTAGCAVTSNTFTRITEAKFDDLDQVVIPGAYGAALDLVPIDANSGSTVMAGGRLPSFDVLFFNNSNANPASASYGFDVRLSSNSNISPTDPLLQTRTYSWNFGPRSSARITANSTAPRVPLTTTPGSYFVGAIQTTTDANAGNDETDGWDAHPITVTARPAQVAYDSNIGASLGGLGDDQIVQRNLGFSFRFPNGANHTSIDISSNGRIFGGGTGTTDFSESVAELLSQSSSLCALWDDLVPAGHTGTGDVYFRTTSSKAVITYRNVRQFSGAEDFSFQVQLFPGGRFAVVYDARLPNTLESLVGFSAGGGASDPGGSNLSGQPATDAGTSTLYEDFANVDLAGLSVQFQPDGNSGWIVSTGPANFPLPPAATTEQVGRPCITSIEFVPNGAGYTVRNCGNCFENSRSTALTVGDDTIASGNVLGFPFRFPNGATVTSIDVDSNGRILPPGANTSVFVASVAGLLSGVTSICPFHTDLAPNLGGSVRFYASPTGSFATVTWSGVPQYQSNNALTVQVMLRRDHSFVFSYFDVTGFVADDLLIGYSAGNGALDPGESDLTSLPYAAGRTSYEFIPAGSRETLDLQLELRALDTPVLGNPWRLVQNHLAPGTSGAFLLLGFSNPAIDLSLVPALGLDGCLLLVQPTMPAIQMSIDTSGRNASVTIPIDSNLNVLGLPLYVQGANFSPGTTTLGVELSNGVLGLVGF